MIPTAGRPPKGLAIRCGFFNEAKGYPESRLWFDLAREVEVEGEGGRSKRYRADDQVMQRLFEELKHRDLTRLAGLHAFLVSATGAAETTESGRSLEEQIASLKKTTVERAAEPYRPAEFRPRVVPIVLHGREPDDVFRLTLGRWCASGPECECRDLRLKTPTELQQAEPAKAFEAQGLADLPAERRGAALEWRVGACTRTKYQQETKNVRGKSVTVSRRVGSEPGTCDPLLCPHYKSADPKRWRPCLPNVTLTCQVPWAGDFTWAYFHSRGWNTADRLRVTLGNLFDNLGGNLVGVQALLVLEPFVGHTPEGAKTKPLPQVYVEPDGRIEDLRERAQAVLALRDGVYNPKALPAPESVIAEPRRQTMLAREWGDAGASRTVRVLSPEEEFVEAALDAGWTQTQAEAELAKHGGDGRAALAALTGTMGGEGGNDPQDAPEAPQEVLVGQEDANWASSDWRGGFYEKCISLKVKPHIAEDWTANSATLEEAQAKLDAALAKRKPQAPQVEGEFGEDGQGGMPL